MQVTVKLQHLRIAPRKIRLLADLLREKKVAEAKRILDFSLQRGSIPLKKLLESGIMAAKDKFQTEEENLRIAEIKVDEGPKLKRWRPRSRGQTYQILKRTSHVSLTIEGESSKKKGDVGPKPMVKQEKERVEKPVFAEMSESKTEKPELKEEKPERRRDKKLTGFLSKSRKGSWKKIFRRKAF